MKINLLGAWIDSLTMEVTLKRVKELVKNGQPHQVVTLNPEILYQAQLEKSLLDIINNASLVTPDGIGIVWASRLAGCPVPERITGIDLMLQLMVQATQEKWRVFLLGAAPGVARAAAVNLQEQYPELQIVGTYHGYFTSEEEPEVVAMVRAARPHLLFVALGAPKQEIFISKHLCTLNVPLAIGVGGSFDVLAGQIQRVPEWMQRLNLEWLGRVIQQPRRWRRLKVLPIFAWLVIKKKFFKIGFKVIEKLGGFVKGKKEKLSKNS